MKVKLHKLSLGLATSMVLFAALPAHAQLNKYGCIYAVDPYGKIVKDPYGNCIRTPYWTAEKNVPECGAVAVVEPATPVVETLSLGADAYFDFDRADLKPAGRAKLDKLVTDLRRVSSVSSIEIVGHTDSKGTEAYNYRLGQRRADSVASYLTARGVPSSIISTRSRGELDPVAPNTLPNGKDNPAGRALNRRVVITVTAMEHVISQ
ncbi:MAG TPA: OmpA family protein [Candidatus Competibacter sp.]|nr:OmpA family protein [Candidatus Competibacteraceae bacterium]HPE71974.1 OmpA family protein [Candidatus Competibacter sp.]HRW66311.1 OmpA family protein [Candidatus Competibacter sp.]